MKLDHMIAFIAVAFPMSALPQVTEIWWHKNTAGVSLITWVLFLVLTIPLLIYAMRMKDHKLSIMYCMWSVIYVFIIAGLIVNT